MFTGIIAHCGKLIKKEQQANALKFWLETEFTELQLGESIAMDGVCLTVTAINDNQFACDVSPETLRLTTLGKYEVGQRINFERPLRPIDRMGGHFVSGHVDQTMILKERTMVNEFIAMTFVGSATEHYLVTKGSIAINGVSLTINAVIPKGFEVMLIPHTLERTNLSSLKIGDRVNIEYDMLTKMVARQLAVSEV